MTDREAVKQTAELLRSIIRSIDKELDYSVMDQTQEGRFSLRLSTRGRQATVSLPTEDLLAAARDAVRKNQIRQKIKSKRDHLLSEYVEDVTGKKIARLLKQAGGATDEPRRSYYRRPQGRRR
jgi:hypothetical protein